jgi:hypothetical protein
MGYGMFGYRITGFTLWIALLAGQGSYCFAHDPSLPASYEAAKNKCRAWLLSLIHQVGKGNVRLALQKFLQQTFPPNSQVRFLLDDFYKTHNEYLAISQIEIAVDRLTLARKQVAEYQQLPDSELPEYAGEIEKLHLVVQKLVDSLDTLWTRFQRDYPHYSGMMLNLTPSVRRLGLNLETIARQLNAIKFWHLDEQIYLRDLFQNEFPHLPQSWLPLAELVNGQTSNSWVFAFGNSEIYKPKNAELDSVWSWLSMEKHKLLREALIQQDRMKVEQRFAPMLNLILSQKKPSSKKPK